MPDFTSLLIDALERIGIARGVIMARLEALRAKYPDADIPLSEIENVINQYISSENIKNLVAGAAADFKVLFQTGKSPIGDSDPSALA